MRNVSFYKFVTIDDPLALKEKLVAEGQRLGLRGTILLAHEGLNAMLSGEAENVDKFIEALRQDDRFASVKPKNSFSQRMPFKHFLVKIKKEIITFRQPGLDPVGDTAPFLKPDDIHKWYQEGREFIILDTRNDYEVKVGTFRNAVHFPMKSFSQLPDYLKNLEGDKDKPIVTFCTGGIRCEKATAYMKKVGFKDIYQIEGGILEYLAQTTGEFWDGQCFIFDEREALDHSLQPAKP